MSNERSTNNDFIDDPALGGTTTRQRARRETRPRPVPDSVGPSTASRPKKKTVARPNADRSSSYNFLRDYRVHLSVGLVLCTLALTMAVATVSFIFNAAQDQSVIHGRSIDEIVNSGEAIATAGGALGAKVAEWLLVDTFGVASFVLVVYLFLLGLGCMRVRRTKFFSLTFRCLFTAVALSVILGMLTYNSSGLYNLGGDHGYYINTLVMTYADSLGVFALSALLAGFLVAVYYYPLKSLFGLIGKAFARKKPKNTPVEKPAEEPVENHLEAFGSNGADEVVSGSYADPVIEAAPAEEPDVEETAGTEENADEEVTTPRNRYSMPDASIFDDNMESVEQAETPVAPVAPSVTPVASVAPVSIPADTEPVPRKIVTVIPPAEPEEIPSEPEMVIVNTAAEENVPVASKTEIRNGDHIGLDSLYDVNAEHSRYQFPSLDLLVERPKTFEVNEDEQAANKQMIVQALRSYNIEIVRIEATIGPTVTLYEIVPSQGTRIAKIKSLEDDIAMSLSALGIRIIAPIPGHGTIGIEVPNGKPQIVSMRNVLMSRKFTESKMRLPMALGSTISNEIYMADLAKMPHLLVAGATGQGKSVGLNCIITSLLYSKHPDELKLVLIDPKMVEFSLYRTIDRQYLAKIPDEDNAVITDPNKVIATLNSLCVEMDQRYELLQAARVRDIEDYNKRFVERRLNPNDGHRFLPYIVMIVDEYADLVMVAGKEIQQPICRIAQKARAVGMHMIIATQRPSTDVITGMIKANFPARIAFKVTQGIDSKTILDRTGAQRLIGRGDMLILINGIVERVQCALVETEEIEAICHHIGSQPGFTGCYLLPEPPADESEDVSNVEVKIDDEFRRCALFIASQSTASITSMQRTFSLGFNKAGRYMDQMQKLGIVGPPNGAKPRSVLMTPDEVQRILE